MSRAFNYVQKYSGVKKIYGDGGNRQRFHRLQPGVVSPSTCMAVSVTTRFPR